MFQNKVDLRINNSKQFVYEALVRLLKNYNYAKITISMIIKKSGVGRTTFYRHFYSKDDIIIYKLKSQTLDLLESLNLTYDLSIYNKDINKKIEFFFNYWNEHPDIINLIILLDKTQMLYTIWPSLLIEMFTALKIDAPTNSSKLYLAHFALGGLTSLLIQWFKNNRKESVDFISKHFYIPN